MKFCTAIEMEVFVLLNSGLSVFNPVIRISNFFDLLKFKKFGMKCSTRLNRITRSQEYKKQSSK